MITVVDYDPAWPRAFDELRRPYEMALGGVVIVAIEHVLSTSVPGLAAKPVIDVDIGSLAVRNHLGVRAVLRGDSALRDECASLERSIAAQVDDIDEYVEAKTTFLSTVLGRAGLTPEERRLVEEANRAR